jgi:hypothetical protein
LPGAGRPVTGAGIFQGLQAFEVRRAGGEPLFQAVFYVFTDDGVIHSCKLSFTLVLVVTHFRLAMAGNVHTLYHNKDNGQSQHTEGFEVQPGLIIVIV